LDAAKFLHNATERPRDGCDFCTIRHVRYTSASKPVTFVARQHADSAAKSNALREQDLEHADKAVREWELLDKEEAARFGDSIEAHELVHDTRTAD
jgi:hypothetical protein